MMKKVILLFSVLLSLQAMAQTDDPSRIFIKALMPDGTDVPVDANSQIETKMQRLLTDNGYADDENAARFVLTAKVDVTSKDITPSTPPRISQKLDVTFFVGDVVENKVYASTTLQVMGVGVNEPKAYISAFNNIKSSDPRLKKMLDDAKAKIIDYYTNNCSELLTKAGTLAAIGKYDEAIANMMSVPNVCNDCFQQCQQKAASIYQQEIDAYGKRQLERARNAWMAKSNADGAKEVANIICSISPSSSIYPQVEVLRKEISDKLSADEKAARDLALKQYNDEQANKRSVIQACRDIGVAWAKNQPKNIIRTIIRGWW